MKRADLPLLGCIVQHNPDVGMAGGEAAQDARDDVEHRRAEYPDVDASGLAGSYTADLLGGQFNVRADVVCMAHQGRARLRQFDACTRPRKELNAQFFLK